MELLDEFDSNHDGEISIDEFKVAVGAVVSGEGVDPVRRKTIMTRR